MFINLFIKQKEFVRMNFFEVLQKLWADFREAYSDHTVIKWSMWWSLSLCGYVSVIICCS